MKTQIVERNCYHHTQIVNSKVFLLLDTTTEFLKKILCNSLTKTKYVPDKSHHHAQNFWSKIINISSAFLQMISNL